MTVPLDVSEFEEANRRVYPICSVRALALTEEQRAKLDAALSRPDITSAAVARVLRTWGFKVQEATVARHRKRKCGCD